MDTNRISSHFTPIRFYTLIMIILILYFSSCSKEKLPDAATGSAAAPANEVAVNAQNNPPIIVQPGSSIQSAVAAAPAGSTILILPGTYTEAITVNQPNIKIMGSGNGEVIIQNPGGANNGINVRDAADGFELKGVTIRNFLRNGVFLLRVDNFTISHVKTYNNGAYGLFPIFSNNGSIDHCEASGHSDTGIYIGQSSGIDMRHNKVYENVNGIEIENCTNTSASKNECFDNVAGILVVLLPGLTSKVSSGITLDKNHVYNNNHVNFAPPGGGFEAFVPSGSGILLVGSDNVTVSDNQVKDNNFVGIANVSSLLLGAIAGLPPAAFADIEPNPDNVKVVHNHLSGNGSHPPAGLPLPGADLLWDGSGTGNCWKDNFYTISVPAALPVCTN